MHAAGTIGNLLISSELRTRLSAVLVNSVTCIEGLEGLEVKGVVSTGLYSAVSLVDNNLLAQVSGHRQPWISILD
jgi:hypothetical protein